VNFRKFNAAHEVIDEQTVRLQLHPLRRSLFCLVSPTDLPEVLKHEWIVSRANPLNPWYAVAIIRANGEQHSVRMHRLLLGLQFGDERVGDHRNGDQLDNRRGNLRIASRTENSRNRRVIENAHGFKGVVMSSTSRFAARFRGKRIGTFNSAREAAMAYDRAARAHYGEFAATNAEILGAST
jgi:hypothetical protein